MGAGDQSLNVVIAFGAFKDPRPRPSEAVTLENIRRVALPDPWRAIVPARSGLPAYPRGLRESQRGLAETARAINESRSHLFGKAFWLKGKVESLGAEVLGTFP